VSFAAINLCIASQRVIPKVSICLVIDSVRKLLGTPSYIKALLNFFFKDLRTIMRLYTESNFRVSGMSLFLNVPSTVCVSVVKVTALQCNLNR
jgi:hypothetical protein